ncbi:MAG: adenosylcobinamide-GDP ribazoletransferase [Solirubrobacteraceae bacterium]
MSEAGRAGQAAPDSEGWAARASADAVLALTFLTRLPAPTGRDLAVGSLGRSIVWFPVVGALVGGVLGGTRLLAEIVLPAGPATVIALAAAILVTGGLHEDGLADTADGLGAHTTRERKLEIMRDPRVGTFGVLALTVSTLLAWALLSGLDGTECLLAAVAGHALARWAMPVAAALFPPARVGGAGALMTVDRVRLAACSVVAVAVAVAAGGWVGGIAASIAALGAVGVVAGCATRVIGGITGDVYGAIGKSVELAGFAVLVGFWT